MTIEQWHHLSVAAFALSSVFLAITLSLFLILKIPRMFEEMTGLAKKKAMHKWMKERKMGVKRRKGTVKEAEKGRKTTALRLEERREDEQESGSVAAYHLPDGDDGS